MGKKSPKGINTVFKQTASAFRAARQTQVFARIKRNIPYITRKISPHKIVRGLQKTNKKGEKERAKMGKKLSKFAKKIK